MTWVIHIFHALSPLGVPSHCYWSLENHQNSAVWHLVHDVWMAIVHSGLRGHHAVPLLLTPVKNWKSTWAQAVPWYQKLKQQVSIIEQNEPSIPSHAQKFQHQLAKIVIQIDAASAILFWCFHDFHLASATFRLLRLLFRLLATSDTCVQSQPPIGRTLASASYLMNSCLCFRTRLPSSEKRGKNPTTFVDISYHISTAF